MIRIKAEQDTPLTTQPLAESRLDKLRRFKKRRLFGTPKAEVTLNVDYTRSEDIAWEATEDSVVAVELKNVPMLPEKVEEDDSLPEYARGLGISKSKF